MHHDVEQARFNMIEQQIRPWEVLDGTVLELLSRVPREAFVPVQYRGLAFADIEIPIGFGQTMLSPKMEGRILQALEIKPTDKVLEIGTGSGYFTALLASLAQQVHSVEINAELSHQAHLKLLQQQIHNVTLHIGDGARGWPGNAPYDVIVFTGSLALPPLINDQLRVGGRLFAVIGEPPVMEATIMRRISEDAVRQDVIFETTLPQLENAPQPEKFDF
ncbi:protein-L-isoaspartate O-methyltransferase [Methylobacillus sp.]|uniref:protein-L-isoaspartate O-methyltransferase family protein n=1 Tax=Methylobacillus sp. TaxID=56818 RepID=UPI0025800B8E|nr:protein-L-isoaspartate O-methyltransferase [Methylobacillus sp.]